MKMSFLDYYLESLNEDNSSISTQVDEAKIPGKSNFPKLFFVGTTTKGYSLPNDNNNNGKFINIKALDAITTESSMFGTKTYEYALAYANQYSTPKYPGVLAAFELQDNVKFFNVHNRNDYLDLIKQVKIPNTVLNKNEAHLIAKIFKKAEPFFALNTNTDNLRSRYTPTEYRYAQIWASNNTNTIQEENEKKVEITIDQVLKDNIISIVNNYNGFAFNESMFDNMYINEIKNVLLSLTYTSTAENFMENLSATKHPNIDTLIKDNIQYIKISNIGGKGTITLDYDSSNSAKKALNLIVVGSNKIPNSAKWETNTHTPRNLLDAIYTVTGENRPKKVNINRELKNRNIDKETIYSQKIEAGSAYFYTIGNMCTILFNRTTSGTQLFFADKKLNKLDDGEQQIRFKGNTILKFNPDKIDKKYSNLINNYKLIFSNNTNFDKNKDMQENVLKKENIDKINAYLKLFKILKYTLDTELNSETESSLERGLINIKKRIVSKSEENKHVYVDAIQYICFYLITQYTDYIGLYAPEFIGYSALHANLKPDENGFIQPFGYDKPFKVGTISSDSKKDKTIIICKPISNYVKENRTFGHLASDVMRLGHEKFLAFKQKNIDIADCDSVEHYKLTYMELMEKIKYIELNLLLELHKLFELGTMYISSNKLIDDIKQQYNAIFNSTGESDIYTIFYEKQGDKARIEVNKLQKQIDEIYNMFKYIDSKYGRNFILDLKHEKIEIEKIKNKTIRTNIQTEKNKHLSNLYNILADNIKYIISSKQLRNYAKYIEDTYGKQYFDATDFEKADKVAVPIRNFINVNDNNNIYVKYKEYIKDKYKDDSKVNIEKLLNNTKFELYKTE